MSDTLAREMLKQKAKARKDPEFAAAEEELAHKLTWATMMRDAGRLTKAEFQEFESHLTSQFLDSLPVADFVEMQKDGRYSDLETIARRIPDESDGYDVTRARKELERRVTRDALDEGFAAGLINSKRYNQEHRAIGTLDDKMAERVTDADDNDGDHDIPAYETLFNRTLPPGDTEPLPAPETGAPKDASED